MEDTGNIEPKKSAFRVKTKVGSAQGMRQSVVIGELIPPVLQNLRSLTRQEDKPSQVPQSTQNKKELDLTQSEVIKKKPELENGEPETLVKKDDKQPDPEEGIEKGEDYTIKNFKVKTNSLKQQATIKMSKTFVYQDLEIFATRFSPDDTCLAIGLSNGLIEIKQLSGSKKNDSFQTSIDELPATHIRWKSNKRLLVSNVEGFLIEYDTVECR